MGVTLKTAPLPPLSHSALEAYPWFPWVRLALTGVSSPTVSSNPGPVLQSPTGFDLLDARSQPCKGPWVSNRPTARR